IGLAILLVLSVVYLILRNGDLIINALGVKGMRVIQRLMGLILMVIAVQFVINGITTVLQPLMA
ncbi:MAG TPA: MarC family protein, partial [Candidatus Marinimicrobia bacterium]|nr:MarC family protein [Candidatus Neomarinimicrobiota bacterium]